MTELPPRVIRLHPSDNVVDRACRTWPRAPRSPECRHRLPGPRCRAATRSPARAIRQGRRRHPLRPDHRRRRPRTSRRAPISTRHNLGMGAHEQDYAFGQDCRPLPPPTEPRTFMGYHRADGKVGTRNYLGILTSVNCSGSVARFIAEAAEKDPVPRLTIPTSTASCPSSTAPAAACRARTKATTRCSAR